MRKITMTLLLLMPAITWVHGQQKAVFKATVNPDSVLLGNRIEVTFLLENGDGNNFQPPAFEGFDVVEGPSTYSSVSIVNGKVSKSFSYKYTILPGKVGEYYIDPASIEVEDSVLETEPLSIIVLPNPEGVIQTPEDEGNDSDFWDFNEMIPRENLPQEKTKTKKRKIYKL